MLLICGVWLQALVTQAGNWVTGYYPGYRQVSSMPASSIDFTAVTHIIHFSLIPGADGSLNSTDNSITPAGSSDLVSRAHGAGKKVLICVGGAGSQSAFASAASAATLNILVSNIVSFTTNRNYDGVDIDWEPLDSSNATKFSNFVTALRGSLGAARPGSLLTSATATEPALYAALQNQFDQVNLMTYDMAGTSIGWVTWFNAPIFDGGYRFASNGNLIPSADGLLKSFIAAGVATNKLSIGIAFYGYIESGGAGTSTGGVTQPRQSWTTPPGLVAYSYTDIMAVYYQSNLYHWDAQAQAPYLSITNVDPANDMFISYDDERSCQAKVSYARNHGLGGVMIWELGQDHQANVPDPLLQAVKQAMASPGRLSMQRAGDDVKLSFTGIALGAYQIQWTSNLAGSDWKGLANSNVAGAGGDIQITDFGVVTNQRARFYRVKTPP